MAKLHLVKTDSGKFFLQGTGERTRNADFSLYYADGEGGDPFDVGGGERWEIVDGVPGVEYDTEDSDTFWDARSAILKAAKKAGIKVRV